MHIDNGMNNYGKQQYLPVDGAVLYDALLKRGFKIWKVGQLYYLMHYGRAVNVETTSALNAAFYQLGMLHVDNALIGPPHKEFMELVRNNAESFDLYVTPLLTPEQKKEYQKAKKASVSHRVFFRRWMFARKLAKNITTNK